MTSKRMLTERRPVYVENGNRIVSCPGGLWQAQQRVGEKGTPTKDNWSGVHMPTTKEAALEQARTYKNLSAE